MLLRNTNTHSYPDIIRILPKAPNKGVLRNYAERGKSITHRETHCIFVIVMITGTIR